MENPFKLERDHKAVSFYSLPFLDSFHKLVQQIEKERADPKFKKKGENVEKKLPSFERLYRSTEKAKKYGIIQMFNAES